MNAAARAAALTSDIDVNDLAQLAFFRGVNLNEIARTLAGCAVRTLAPNTLLIAPGMTNDRLYVLLEGRMRVYAGDANSVPSAELKAGDCIGELSLFDREPTSAFVVAADTVKLLAIDEPTFWLLIDSSHGMARNLLFVLAQRLRRNRDADEQYIPQDRCNSETAPDVLTGLNDCSRLNEHLPLAVGDAVRGKRPLSLVMLDIDRFKHANDRYGRANGDEILRAIARMLAHSVRPSDFVARHRGGQFIAVLPNTPINRAALVAERLRKAIADTVISGVEGIRLPSVTISLGIAQWRAPQDAQTLLGEADAALYRAKTQGRNCICIAV